MLSKWGKKLYSTVKSLALHSKRTVQIISYKAFLFITLPFIKISQKHVPVNSHCSILLAAECYIRALIRYTEEGDGRAR